MHLVATIELEQIHKTFGNKIIFEQVQLTARAGDFIALLGKSGVGKSTLLNILVGLERATSGSYQLDGIEITQKTTKEIAHIRSEYFGFIAQHSPIIPGLTVQDNICIPLWIGKRRLHNEQLEFMMELCNRLDLTKLLRQKAGRLSGGELQRVGLIRALLKKPKLIVADEPTGALDDETADSVILLLREMCEQGATVVIATHSQQVANQCDKRLELTSTGLHALDVSKV